jgi:PAS domain S-box-containing protein
MNLLLTSTDDEVITLVEEAVTGLGHELQRWSPEEGPAPEVHVAIFDGLEALVLAGAMSTHTLVLASEEEMELFAECPHPITDFLLKPIRSGELTSRLMSLCSQRSWKEQTHRDVLGKAVDSATDIFELTDTEAVFEYVNPAFEKVVGFGSNDAIGKTSAALMRSDHHEPEFFREIKQSLDAGKPWSGVIVSRTRSGRLVHLESTIAPVTNKKGDITHHVAVKRDITERLARDRALHESNRALEQARDAAVSASKAKSEFLANMSHELRTPLNAIIGYSEMLAEDYEDNPQTVSDLARIRSAGKHLLELINDVLNISKIEADKIELYPEDFAVRDLIESVAETIRPMASKNKNKFEVHCSEEVSTLFADKTRVQQVLLNLLSNACKFTEEGEVTLEVDLYRDNGASSVRFQVKDSGIGISEAQAERLFKPFSQADSSTTRKYGGTGLGLVISQRFTEMMQGSIAFDSEPGIGTTFTVTLPLKTITRRRRPTSRAPIGSPVVLIIDDDASVRDLFSRSLTERGFEVCCAPGGVEGIKSASQIQPDVIVLDVKMPGMSGWEVLSTLKLEEQTANIPVIMMTILEQEDIGRALGASDYLLKPIEPAKLTEAIERYVTKTGAQILVVEDDEPTRDLMCRTLASAGHRILEAENGRVALDLLDVEHPDLIVLDLMMPVMDGFAFLHHVNEDENRAHIPTIVATARSLSEVERRELREVTERVIQKGSYSREELLDTICRQANKLIAHQKEQNTPQK